VGIRAKSLVLALIITAIAAVFLLYHFHTLNLVVLRNESNAPLTNVTIKGAGDIRWKGDIGAGETLKFRFVAEREGAIEIIGIWKGVEFNPKSVGYVHSNSGTTIDIVFNDRGLFS
jgi:hypothetical protein